MIVDTELKKGVVIKFTKKKGFTLIELLVVIAIILVLATIIFISATNSSIKARNTKRTADINSVKTALGQYREDYGSYPLCIDLQGNSVEHCDLSDIKGVTNKYIAGMPVDPKTGSSYKYRGSSDSYSIKIDYEKINNEKSCYVGVNLLDTEKQSLCP